MEKVLFSSFSNVFDRFRPCERMREHAFAGQNTQHLSIQTGEQKLGMLRSCSCPFRYINNDCVYNKGHMKPQKNGRFDSICPICYVPGHLISQGTADILLDACADLWTGSDLEPLTDDVTTIFVLSPCERSE